VCSCGSDYLPKIQWKDTAKSVLLAVEIFVCSEFVKMVLVNYRQSYDDYCRYNFCSGKHQYIEQKTKSIPNPNGYLLLALANSVKNRLFQENSKVYYQQKANVMFNYSTKNNKKSAKQFKKRALKLTICKS